ncbi:lipid A biosynthesis lauroyl acyltransferase [Roseomonas sp. HF4]|uniref:lipid A biosynthesis lauroyl acyltransferase n=1 Tax=Roseomonas sp. HF4 TaxID=2562313 RepID=UPI0010C12DDB|nr:lipid A biosynthesis lauroyl acyltransferase [Roseomonas sp. HF4]
MLRFKVRLWLFADRLFGLLVRAVFALLRLLGPDIGPRIGAFLARSLGPLTSANRIGRENIAAAFPGKSEAERAAILTEAWDNLGRVACEYVHMDRIWDFDAARPDSGRITASPETVALYERLRDDGKPAIVFSAHLANWELPAIAAAKHGIESAVLYRTPNSPAVAKEILRLRQDSMGTLVAAGMSAPFKLARALERGLHVGMLVDQRFGRGPVVTFMGRPASANPLLAQLARRFDCPVHGARAIRLPGGRFRLDLTEEIPMPRDAEGLVDVEGATQAMNTVIEGWVRECPGQWLWMHRRWR